MASDQDPSNENLNGPETADKTVPRDEDSADGPKMKSRAKQPRLGRGDIIGNLYKVLDFLGSGGMSDVYKCEDLSIGRIIAVKTLKFGYNEDLLRRFQTEAKAIARLEHPNIVKLYGLQTIGGGIPLLLMEYVPGKTLAQLIRKGNSLPVQHALKIASQVIEALKSAEQQGVIHRDLKPSNIMIMNPGALDETVKILDFGIAKIQGEPSINATQTGEVFGTPKYMSPEQVLGKKCDGRADQYAFGCILFEMLTGSAPYHAENAFTLMMAHANDRIPSLSQRAKQPIPAQLDSVVNKLLQKDPENRFANMEEVNKAIFEKNEAQIPSHKILIASALACFLAMALTVSIILNGRSKTPKESTAEIDPLNPAKTDRKTDLHPAKIEISTAAKEPSTADKKLESEAALVSRAFVLDLGRQNITDFGLSYLSNAKHLRNLNLSGNRHITNEGVKRLEGLKLQNLNLADTGIDDGAAQSIAKISTLKELMLNHTDITDETCKSLSGLPALRRLWVGTTGVDGGALPYLAKIKTLRFLDLSEDNVSENLDELSPLPIEELCLAKIPNAQEAVSRAVSGITTLQIIDLRKTGITSFDLEQLAHQENLKKIYLEGCPKISIESIDAIRKRQSFPIIVVSKRDDTFQTDGPELLKNGSFEMPSIKETSVTINKGSEKLESWKVLKGDVDLVSSFRASDGKNVVDLSGSNKGTIAQTIATIPGTTYILQFDAAGNPHGGSLEERFVVTAGDASKTILTRGERSSPGHMDWHHYEIPFKAKEAKTTIVFEGMMGGSIGSCLDSVSVRKAKT